MKGPILLLTQISMPKGRSEEQKRSIMENIYVAMEETFAVPDGDRFMTINKCENADFAFGYRYPNVERSDDLVIIQIAVSDNRIREQKLALYKEMNKELGARQLPA